MGETADARLKRLAMRSARRGTKEMDLILGAYARDRLAEMDEAKLQLYDAMLGENDHDLYRWVTGQDTPPDRFAGLVADVAAHTRAD
ncbi:MAG: succinate dehydrogenase assembly factor 2 [Rhodobacter sp.]|nr:succinate dehydrogenase assembly factor 2 [Rhodobacter sp.]